MVAKRRGRRTLTASTGSRPRRHGRSSASKRLSLRSSHLREGRAIAAEVVDVVLVVVVEVGPDGERRRGSGSSLRVIEPPLQPTGRVRARESEFA